MEALPREIVRVLRVFEDVFSERVWDWVQVLVIGAILTPGQRTVAAVLRVMGLAEVPWAGRIWGLPFLTVLAPSERYHQTRGRRHKTLPDWGRQMIRQVRRWLPDRELVVVADSTYAVLELLADAARLAQPVTVV